MTSHQVDVAVIGGGAAGLAAVREARRRGATALLVNDGPPGGDCTFTGCVPSKAVIEAARTGLGFDTAFERARGAVERIAATESTDILRREGIEVVEGEGVLVGPGQVRAAGRQVEARGVVLALGSRPLVPPIPGLAEADPLTSETLWHLELAPASLAVLGGGPMGCELSQALATLGVATTLIEAADRVLPGEEEAASAVVRTELEAAGVAVRTGTSVQYVDIDPADPTGSRLVLADGSSVRCQHILVATGRRARSDRGGLAELGIALDDTGAVVVGSDLATSLDRTWAAGDLTGISATTHGADHMGRLAAANICRRVGRGHFRPEQIPRVTFTHPEVAAVGLSEADAARTLAGARVAELPLSEHDRAVVAGRTEGYLKLIAAPRRGLGNVGGGRLVGATVVADRAGELIAELTLALHLKAFVGRLAVSVHPYPTWSYAIPKAAAQFFTTIEGRTARPARAGAAAHPRR